MRWMNSTSCSPDALRSPPSDSSNEHRSESPRPLATTYAPTSASHRWPHSPASLEVVQKRSFADTITGASRAARRAPLLECNPDVIGRQHERRLKLFPAGLLHTAKPSRMLAVELRLRIQRRASIPSQPDPVDPGDAVAVGMQEPCLESRALDRQGRNAFVLTTIEYVQPLSRMVLRSRTNSGSRELETHAMRHGGRHRGRGRVSNHGCTVAMARCRSRCPQAVQIGRMPWLVESLQGTRARGRDRTHLLR